LKKRDARWWDISYKIRSEISTHALCAPTSTVDDDDSDDDNHEK